MQAMRDSDYQIPGSWVVDEQGLCQIAKALCSELSLPAMVHLSGDLGAGKTTFARALLAEMEVSGAVKSPTYTLVESHPTDQGVVNHFDLYRLEQPDELEYLGFADLVADSILTLIEWPERAAQLLPEPDYRVLFGYAGELRQVSVQASKTIP